MSDGHTPSRPYRLFQKVATGVGVVVAAVGGLLFAARDPGAGGPDVGGGLLVVGGTLLVHGLVALAVIRYEDRKAARQR